MEQLSTTVVLGMVATLGLAVPLMGREHSRSTDV